MQYNQQLRKMMFQPQTNYQAAPFRTPFIAGRGYPAYPDKLQPYLDEYIADAQRTKYVLPEHSPTDIFSKKNSVPDFKEQVYRTLPENYISNESTTVAGKVRGLLSPHIDYARGGSVYGAVWKDAAEAVKQADLVIMIGTDHYGHDPFTLTRQHYATPYGVLPTAVDIVDKLAIAIDGVSGNGAAYHGEFRHSKEHSLELVSVWLHHMLEHTEKENSCELVPILCGGLHHHIYNATDPADDLLLNRVLEVLQEVCKDRNALVVASGDLAHVGPAFSGPPLNEARRTVLQNADRMLIESMVQGDSHAFFESIRSVKDHNNVCGVTPIYLTMRLLSMLKAAENAAEGLAGTAVAYDTCPADDTNTSVVTISGILFS